MDSLPIGTPVTVKGHEGEVRFVGRTQFAPGVWVGVELYHPVGKNNGSINGVKYFKCTAPGNYGLFASPTIVHKRDVDDAAVHDQPLKEHLVIDKLQVKLQEAVRDIKEYKSQVEVLQSQLEQTNVDRDFFEVENTRLQADLTALQARYDSIVKELATIQEELELNKQLEDEIMISTSDNDVVSLAQKNKRLELALATFKGVAETQKLDLTSQIESLKLQLDSRLEPEVYQELTQKLGDAEETIFELKSQLESLQESDSIVNRLATENDMLNVQLKELKAQFDELMALQEIDKSLEQYQSEIEIDLRTKVGALQKESADKSKKTQQLETAIRELNMKITNMQNMSGDYVVDREMQAHLQNMRLELAGKTRELEFAAVVLQICNRKLDLYKLLEVDDSIKFKLQLTALVPLQSACQEQLKMTDTPTLKFKLTQVSAYLQYLYSVGEDAVVCSESIGGIQTLVESLLLSVEQSTLVSFSLVDIQRVINNIFTSNDKNVVHNKFCVNFISFECAVMKAYFSMIDKTDNHLVSEIKVLVESLLTKTNRTFDVDVDDRFSIKLNNPLVFLLNEYFGSYEVDLEESLNSSEYVLLLEGALHRFNSYKLELEREFKQIEETKVVANEPSKALRDDLQDKETKINDLELTVQLLEANMSNLSVGNKKKLDGLQHKFNSLKGQYDTLLVSFSELEQKNKLLEVELESLISSGKYFNIDYIHGRFNSMDSERSFVENLHLVQEIAYLRGLISRPGKSDLSWLKTERTSKDGPVPGLHTVAPRLQKIANSLEVLRFQAPGEWRPKKKNPKFIIASISEQFYQYEKDRNRVLKIGKD